MKKLFAILLLGIITNKALGSYESNRGGPNYNNYHAQPLPYISSYYPVPLIPDYPQPLSPIPKYPQSLVPDSLQPSQPYSSYSKLHEPSKYQLRYKRQANEEEFEDRYDFERPRQNWFQPGNQPFQRQTNQPNRPGGRPFPRPNGGQGFPIPNQNQGSTQPTQGPTQPNQDPNNMNTTQDPSAACISACPVTSEYNPVCGTNGVTYPNPGRLSCAQLCGVNVNLSRQSPCPTTTTAAPTQN